MAQTRNYIYISLLRKCESIWIWNLGRLICIYPDRWHTVLLEIDFMMNKMCLESSRSPSGLIFGVWHVFRVESGCCPSGLIPWLYLCSEVSSELVVSLRWIALPWPSSALANEYRREEILIEKNSAWNSCRGRNFKWCHGHRAFAVGLTANL